MTTPRSRTRIRSKTRTKIMTMTTTTIINQYSTTRRTTMSVTTITTATTKTVLTIITMTTMIQQKLQIKKQRCFLKHLASCCFEYLCHLGRFELKEESRRKFVVQVPLATCVEKLQQITTYGLESLEILQKIKKFCGWRLP